MKVKQTPISITETKNLKNTKNQIKMRKLKVNTKLTIRKVKRLDNTDKFGLTFGLVFMLPAVTMLLIDIFTNGAKML